MHGGGGSGGEGAVKTTAAADRCIQSLVRIIILHFCFGALSRPDVLEVDSTEQRQVLYSMTFLFLSCY